MIPYTPPMFKEKAFNCPQCNAYANHLWYEIILTNKNTSSHWKFPELDRAECTHCQKYTLWHNGIMIYPDNSGVPPPNLDLNKDIQQDYIEAASIVNKSPRGASALLRLCIQKLCKQLGESDNKLNSAIANLVKKGLPLMIQQSLDIVRVIGNNAVHPGTIDLKDDKNTAMKLFQLINLIADVRISQPKQIKSFYDTLPELEKKQVDKRDSENSKP